MKPLTTLITALSLAALIACGKDKSSDTASSGGVVATDTAKAATANAALNVADVTLGRQVDSAKKVTNATDTFAPHDEIYASVHTTGAASGSLAARWTFQDGQVVDERTETITGKGDDYTEFHISKPSGWPVGKYTLHVMLSGNEVQTKDFTVK
jgi:hypothetical protein